MPMRRPLVVHEAGNNVLGTSRSKQRHRRPFEPFGD
jgi:hypothetical protein